MKKIQKLLPVAAALLLAAGNLFLVAPASAAQINSTAIRLNRMATGQTTGFRLLIKPVTASVTTLSINFNGADSTTWTGSSGTVTGTSETTSGTQCTADGFTAIGGTPSFTGSSGSTIAITGLSGMSSTSTVYCLDFTNTASLTTPTAGEYHPTITQGTDTSTIALRVVGTNADQIQVTASVPANFNLALTANSDALGVLSPGGTASSTGVTANVNTNAKNGWIAWIKDANAGLTSANASKTIASGTAGSAVTLSAGTEGYGVGIGSITQGSGSGTATGVAAYTGTYGGGVDTTLRKVIDSTGTAGGASFVIKEYAAISSTTPPATDYSDTVTVVGAGSF